MKILPIILRPHHFLCLKGYKGYNYNSAQIGVWDNISSILRNNPDSNIIIGKGKDTLCSKCPANKGKFLTCIEKNILELDKKVRTILCLKTGEQHKYSDVVKRMNKKITKEKHEELCSKCFWWQKGLCHDSFKSMAGK